jgi:threo-3-hydroxy-L-aspartate ammonia-lyase
LLLNPASLPVSAQEEPAVSDETQAAPHRQSGPVFHNISHVLAQDTDSNTVARLSDIATAYEQLKPIVHRTPLLTSSQVDKKTGAAIFFKCENFQRGGAFEFRGAYCALSRLDALERARGVVTYACGNHGPAIALAADMLNIRATVVMPDDTAAMKISAARGYGADIVFYNPTTDDGAAVARHLASDWDACFVPPSGHLDVNAGHGSVAMELFAELGQLDVLFVPLGDNGLLSGCAIAARHLSPGCTIVGVELKANSARGRALCHSQRVRPMFSLQNTNSGLHAARLCADAVVTVEDELLRDQMSFFAERMKIVVEPSGCLAAAAAMSGLVDIVNKRVGVIVTGVNVDMGYFSRCLSSAHGMV